MLPLIVTVFLVTVCSVSGKVGDPETPGVYTTPPRPSGDVYFVETFNYPKEFEEKWVKSEAKKEGVDEDIAKYNGDWSVEAPSVGGFEEDKGLVMKTGSKHYAISAKLEKPFKFQGKDLFIVQYEVNFQEGMSCGGAYLKLLSAGDALDLKQFHDKVPYTIMFGPDKCGGDAKLHFIFRHKNPKTGEYEEKHAKRTDDLKFFDDKKTHLFTLIVRADNTYSILVDQFSVNDGNLLEDFTPAVNPDKEIDDPDDKKPKDWDDRPKIPEPNATKPDDWDEDAPAKISDPDAVKPEGWLDEGPEYIPDPEAAKPEDWDDEMDGDWEAPMIPNPACEDVGCGEWKAPLIANPAYKGKWSAPMIDNPDYKGEWKPRRIPNPNYFEDKEPFNTMTTIAAVGFELWTITGGVYFDNLLVTSELTVANNFAYDGWVKKFEKEKGQEESRLPGWLDQFVEYANEFPFLWFVYVVVFALPCVLLACCCVRSKPAPSPSEVAARKKKTDEPSPDVPPEEEEEEEEETDAAPKASKEDESFIEEVEPEGLGKESQDEEPEEEETEKIPESIDEEGKQEEEEEEEAEGEDEEEVPKESPKKQTRRRKRAQM